ncbi:MAG TPA: translation initiation factor IF-2 [Tepidisphaeraceae bacterium]|nr:translation initiation factor IF-2 [Tepidisphaeraceae bacterium]
MAKATGIRVNQLAKELGVESKSILNKLREEGLGDQAPNHMSVLKLGLAQSVRDWFSGGGGGGTAVETAAPVAVEVKPKKPRVKVKKATDGDELPPTDEREARTADEDEHETAEPVAEIPHPSPAPSAPAPVAEAAPVAPVAPMPAPAPEAPAPVAEHVATPAPAPSVPAAAPVTPGAPAHVAPPPVAPAAAVAAHGPSKAPVDPNRPPVSRPTVTLSNRGTGPAVVERKAITPAPKLLVPEPAKIQGPKVIREEKPDNLPAPRRRPAPGTGGPAGGPAFNQARPIAGRGVKVSEEEEEEAKKKAAAAKGRSLSNRRRGLDGRRGEAMEKLRDFSEQDLKERQVRLSNAASHKAEFDRHLKGAQQRGTHIQAKTAVERGEPVDIEEPITVKSLSAALGIKSNDIITKLMKQGVFATVNQSLDPDTAGTIALEYGVELQIAQQATLEESLLGEFESRDHDPANLQPRPPVVTILGHVDHGKTSLLDKIRSANVAAGEAGGITQHTAAWMVQLGEKRVTFIDTPGHQAFTAMRARGAHMTDIVVLVVSAAEGVQPQTVESLNHARAAEVPIVVALNKIDRPDANPDMVLGQLAGQGLNPVEWGGDTEVIRTSATTGQGVQELIEMLDFQASLLELKADPTVPARGTVIESSINPGLGPVATVLVQDGTLRVGDTLLAGPGYGRVRTLLNDRGESIQEAPPSMPVVVAGLSDSPDAGDKFFDLQNDMDRARSIAEERSTQQRQTQLAQRNTATTLNNLYDQIQAGQVKTINLIIKGDVQGSVETLSKTVTDANTDEVKVRVIHSAVGPINESDVELGDASSAVIIGFNVVPDEAARSMAEQRRVEIRTYRVIYEIFDDLKKALSGLLAPEIREKLHGHAEIRQVFKVSRVGNIAGCFVTDGHIQRGSRIRLVRGGTIITDDIAIETLRRVKDDVKEVKAGLECGIKLAGYDDIKIGDVMEAYIRETIQRTL